MSEQPSDIRNESAEQYWETFEQKWTSLLSYRYLGRRNANLDAGVVADTMPLRHDMRNALGGIMVAPLCIASPESGGMADDLYVPNPVIASMQILDDARDVRRVDILPETIRIGRSMGFSRSRIVDADDPTRVIAISEGMGVSLGEPPGDYEKVDNPPLDIVDSPTLPPLTEVFGATRRGAGEWELPPLVDELASPDAALHLGPQHVVLEAAATDLAAVVVGCRHAPDRELARDVRRPRQDRSVSRGGAAIAGTDGRVGARVQLYDEGNGDRVVTSAAGVFRGPG